MRYIFLLTLLLIPFQAFASGIETSAKQAIVIDYDTGSVLLSKNAEEKMPTSSMSKVITAAVIFDALKSGTLKLDGEFNVSEKAWRKEGSKMFVEVNKQVKIEDLLRGVIIQSGNDATIVLAEGLSGDEETFAKALNAKAKEIGMNNSQFKNASGWPDPDHYSTAKDLALLAKYLIKNYPVYYKYYSETEFEYNGIKQPNRNPLLYKNIGADGVKTGHTDAGGYGLIGSGTKDGRRVILVVNGLDSEATRSSEAAKLLNWGLMSFENKTLFKAGDIVETAEVTMGKTNAVSLTLKEDMFFTVPKGAQDKIEAKVEYNGPLVAPIKQGDEVASLSIKMPGSEPLSVPLIANENVAAKGFLGKATDKVKALILGR